MKRAQIALVVSLAINLFLLGAIASGVYRWRQAAGIGPSPGWRARAVAALPDGDGIRFRAAMRQTAAASRPIAAIGQRDRREAAALFVAPDFDRAAIAARLRRARAADFIVRASIEERMLAFAATLPRPQRQALAGALRRGPLRQPRARRGG